uniref:Putative kunitz domain protein n=1 Tax=Amblyomma cajennense TaxID=34607 RepID=A0A023FQB2_AMBCJ
MNFLAIILLSCWSGAALAGNGEILERDSPNWPIRGDCGRVPDLTGKKCNYGVHELRYFFEHATNKCRLWIRPKCEDADIGNVFKLRRHCMRTCIPESPCRKAKWGQDKLPKNETKPGYTYYPRGDYCTKRRYKKNAPFGFEHNRFQTADECQEACAPGHPLPGQ